MEPHEALPLISMRNVVVFPHMIMPFIIGRQSSIRAFEHALLKDKRVFLATQRDAGVEEPGPASVYTTGCIANVVQNRYWLPSNRSGPTAAAAWARFGVERH